MQALMDLAHIPHIGADVVGSAVAMDKWLAKAVYREAKIPTADAVLIRALDLAGQGDGLLVEALRKLGLPCVIKTPRLGSSVGVWIARTEAELRTHVASALQMDECVMLEAFAPGRELTVPVLEDPDDGTPRALSVIEIRVKKGPFFDYETKYDPNATEELCPAPIDAELTARLQDLAIRAHRALLLSGFSRTDFIVGQAGIVTLETNTIPGLTQASLFPQASRYAGIAFPVLVDILIRRALNRPPAIRSVEDKAV